MRTLMAIGGGIKQDNPALMREFVRRAGGESARVVIVPQASVLADTGDVVARYFNEMGVRTASVLEFRERSEAGTPQQVELLRSASAIFIAGGTQMRLPVFYGGTGLEEELLGAYQRGCLVGGTSAGAAILSKTMIAYGRGGPTPRERIAQFIPGFGFTGCFIFDQHFRQRDRLGRLIYAVAANPGVVGAGIDENTAAIVEDDDFITVDGTGAVTIVDGRQIGATDVAEVGSGAAVAVTGLRVHVLTKGGTYRRQTGEARI